MIVCRQCGQRNDEGNEFCEACGSYLEWSGERLGESTPAAPAAPPPAAPTPPLPAPAPPPPAPAPPPPPPAPSPPPPAAPSPSGEIAPPPAGSPAPPIAEEGAGRPARSRGRASDAGEGKVRCLECGAYNGPDRRFCLRCGASLDLVVLGGASSGAGRGSGTTGAAGSTSLDDIEPGGRGGPPGPPPDPTPIDRGVPPTPPPPPTPINRGIAPAPPPPPTPTARGVPPTPGPEPVTPGGPGAPPGASPSPGVPPGPAAPSGQGQPPGPAPGVSPSRLASAAPQGERVQGMQPGMAKQRPLPERPAPASEPDVAPGSPICPQCGTANEIGRRFCRKCGAPLSATAPVGGPRASAMSSQSWWQRLKARFRGDPPAGADPGRYSVARSAYKRSLDLRYRALRVVGLLGLVGLGVGAFGIARVNPVTGARDLWRNVFPRYEPVVEVNGTTDPELLTRPEFSGAAAVDGDPSTAWAAEWRLAPEDEEAELCPDVLGGGGADSALLLELTEAADLAKVEIQAGLPEGDPDREDQWRAGVLELRYDDGTCDRIELDDEPGLQGHEIDADDTASVRIAVLDAAQPRSGNGDMVALGEVRLFTQK